MKMIRGETPTFKVYLPSSTTITALGTPTVAVAQNMVLIEPTATTGTDTNGQYVSFSLTEAQSLSLVSGKNAFFQVTWKKNNTVVKGSTHSFWVGDSLIG